MLRTALHPLFVVPSIFFILFVGLSGYVEYTVDDYQDNINYILNDGLSVHNNELYDGIWNLEEQLAQFQDKDKTPEQYVQLKKSLENVSHSFDKINQYLKRDFEEQTEHHTQKPLIEHLDQEIASVKNSLPPTLDDINDDNFKQFQRDIIALRKDVYGFLHQTNQVHEQDIKILVAAISEKEVLRETLAIMALFSILALIGISFKMAARYRQAWENAHASEKRYALFADIIQSTKIGVIIRDMQKPEKPIIFANTAFTEITGYTFEELINKPPYFLSGLHTDPIASRKMWDAFNNRTSVSAELLLYKKDNTTFWGEWHIGPVKQKDGGVSYYFSLITDVTNMRSTRESLLLAKEEAERAANVKSNFLASMSHEIRTPINGVLGILELLSDMHMDDEQKRLLQIASTSGQHLLEIVNDILDYSKIEAGKLDIEVSPFSLRQLSADVINVIQPAAVTKKLNLTLSIAPQTPDSLLSDSGRIRQILINLLSNAIKFTDKGSVQLKIFSLMNQTDDDIAPTLIRFEIIDTGMGISLEDQGKLFNEFTQLERTFSRKFGGTGLGLAITKQLVKLLSGEVGVESRHGQGSKFWVMLPIPQTTLVPNVENKNCPPLAGLSEQINTTPEEPYQACEISTKRIEPHQPHVLLVEDNPVNQLVALRYVQKAGYQVDLAVNGLDALKKVKEKLYDAILMDISMPEMDGLTATKEIRAFGEPWTAIPIIALTAHVMRGDREQCIAAGMNDYLCKPIHFETLKQVLIRWLPNGMPVIAQTEAPSKPISITSTDDLTEFAIFDPAVLERLAADLDKKMVLNITKVFLDDFSKRVLRLKEKLSFSDGREIAKEAHTIKSSSAGCGLLRFSELMRRIEIAGNKGEEAVVQNLADIIDVLYTASHDALSEGRNIYKD